jgi:predicted dinucleotide-binding enzyme
MRIGIIGTGNVGSALGTGWAAKGHTVVFGVRNPGDAKVQPAVTAAGGATRAATVKEAAADAEVVVLATPWGATQDAIKAAGSLSGKIVIDATNPLKTDLSGLAVGYTTSAGEEVAKWAAPGPRS